jgi:hypothetical protein
MAGSGMLPSQPWYTTRRFAVVSVLVLAVALAVEGYLAIFVRNNDFSIHHGMGKGWLAGDPLQAMQNHYLLGRGLINALTAWLPYRLDRALHFVTAVGLLVLTFAWWDRLANDRRPLNRGRAFAAAILTLLLVGGYVQRDLDDCGLQLLLLFFLTAGGCALMAGSALHCGFWLGLAATYKVTPLIFLPFLIWKRQWRAAAWMAAFFVGLNLAPTLYLGWDTTIRCHEHWLQFNAQNLALPDPSQTLIEPPRHLNQGLAVAIARFLQTHPPGHPLWLDHPWFVQPGDLEPATAKWAVQLVLAGLGLLFAWRFRRRFAVTPQRSRDHTPSPLAGEGRGGGMFALADASPPHFNPPPQGGRGPLAPEWAAVTVLCAILSPLCWLQHLALIVPCIFLWCRAWIGGSPIPRWHRPVLAGLALCTVLVHREFVSRDLYELLVSYKVHTLAVLLAILLVLTLQEERAAVEGENDNALALEARARAAKVLLLSPFTREERNEECRMNNVE